jgi:hypothetical protein
MAASTPIDMTGAEPASQQAAEHEHAVPLQIDCELVTGPFGGAPLDEVLLEIVLGHSGRRSMSPLASFPIDVIQREIAPLIRQNYQ